MCVSGAAWPHLTVCNVCFRCSMALLHSRVSRVFYTQPQADGALGSSYKLHTIPSVNHHFEVFHWLGSVHCDRWCWCETLGSFIETEAFSVTDAAGTIYLDVSMRLSSQFYTDVLLVLFQPILCLLRGGGVYADNCSGSFDFNSTHSVLLPEITGLAVLLDPSGLRIYIFF